ncbi:class C beta-lactamase [Pseudomonas gingeri]|uniref:class C beta-lactamase n=1 Tax=Pseudomonas gingeri TaxID=117681 RepID=UPI0015A4A0FC|nr:class C beta-lactamase [Pseudomonas gingeri]NWE25891.1 beta-lactamase [Pseudomonas gingeri]NWE96253.1 beta-lactamase [Pseudomonas gingeri]
MPKKTPLKSTLLAATLCLLGSGNCLAAAATPDELKAVVDAAVRPLMQDQGIPGMAVAILVNGKAHYFNYGITSKTDKQAVTENTLFEIGSVSKTFTATLAAYAVAQGKLSLAENASHYVPELRGSAFDKISVLQLGTYTPGGLPLQFPDESDSADKMISYFKNWKPVYPARERRQYSNPSLGLFGYVAAKSLGQPFDDLMEKTLLPKLGLHDSYVRVPKDQMSRYAQGYKKDDSPSRVGPGAMDSEAYGIKTTSSDLLHYVLVNMQPQQLEAPLQQAIALTHSGYYQFGNTTQGLGWELYPYPAKLDTLLAGNSNTMLDPQKTSWFKAPQPPSADTWVNKTGSTSGFGAYVAYVPTKKIGIVMLANKNYPNPARVKAAHEVLSALQSR